MSHPRNTPDQPSPSALPDQELAAALHALAPLYEEIAAGACQASPTPEVIDPSYRDSARNLLGYLCLRRHDIRPLQQRLARLGLSSLGRSEAHILASVATLLEVLQRLVGEPGAARAVEPVDMARGAQLLGMHTEALFGPPPEGRTVRIMVTMPSEAAHDHELVRDLLAQGMDCMRINCAHDDSAAWERMIAHLRQAEQALGRRCQVMMDLAGPKLRTGRLEPGPAVLKLKPTRDVLGRVIRPARLWLHAAPAPAPADADASLVLPGDWLGQLQPGDAIRLRDARGSKRRLQVTKVLAEGCWVELSRTAYLVPGLELKVAGRKKAGRVRLGQLPAREQAIELHEGDTLILDRDASGGRPARYDDEGMLVAPARIGCTLPEVFGDVRPGEPIWFDDGKIGGLIDSASEEALAVKITHAPGGARLRGDKGINLPDSPLRLDALTAQDLEALAFAARHADAVELSFANGAGDVQALLDRLDRLDAPHLGVVLKIETRRGFENLPAMLLAGMRNPRFGVMIARGDLAVESGFERLAELQEEILCLCEAAHVPVIWATQVLETLAKKGAPSRSEITDAAMGVRAECVMLNKGPHVLRAVQTLDDLLRRMQGHHSKKRDLLRRLNVAARPEAPRA